MYAHQKLVSRCMSCNTHRGYPRKKGMINPGLAALAPLTSLTSLNLCECDAITDAGVAALAPQLHWLLNGSVASCIPRRCSLGCRRTKKPKKTKTKSQKQSDAATYMLHETRLLEAWGGHLRAFVQGQSVACLGLKCRARVVAPGRAGACGSRDATAHHAGDDR